MEKEPKVKIHHKDIIDGTQPREIPTFTANGVKYWGDRTTKEQLATHTDCEDCGIEFEKQYTNDKRCFNCAAKKQTENFNKLQLVEWDGKSALCLYNDDQYFFDMDDIKSYCEDNDTDQHSLKLVLCEETSFGSICVAELFQDDLHEDWEPDAELLKLEKDLNDYLAKTSTRTWKQSKKRVRL